MSTAASLFVVPDELESVFKETEIILPESRAHLFELAFMGPENNFIEVAYDVEGKGRVVEATVARCKNGAAVNYVEPYMRRRDPSTLR